MYAVNAWFISQPRAGQWILPPMRAIWISGGTEHALVVKRPMQAGFFTLIPARGGNSAVVRLHGD